MFRSFNFYRHNSTLDIDIYVLKVQYVGPNYTKLRVHFVDRKHTGVFQSNASIKILKKDYKQWGLV